MAPTGRNLLQLCVVPCFFHIRMHKLMSHVTMNTTMSHYETNVSCHLGLGDMWNLEKMGSAKRVTMLSRCSKLRKVVSWLTRYKLNETLICTCITWYLLVCMSYWHARSGEQLHELLKVHGTFEEVECHLRKWQIEEQRDQLSGGWHTEISLAQMGWDQYHDCISFCPCIVTFLWP